MRNGCLISPAEPIAERIRQFAGKVRMPELLVIIYVRPPVVLEIPPRRLHPFVKSAPLRFVELPRRHIPAALFPHLSDRKSTRLNSSHANISYAVFCLKKK